MLHFLGLQKITSAWHLAAAYLLGLPVGMELWHLLPSSVARFAPRFTAYMAQLAADISTGAGRFRRSEAAMRQLMAGVQPLPTHPP